MLHEALTASESLRARRRRVSASSTMPWLNRRRRGLARGASSSTTASSSCSRTTRPSARSATCCGASCRRQRAPSTVFGVEGWPACGTPPEALRAHGLDGASLADRIALALGAAVGDDAPRRRLARPARPAADARLRRLRDRLRGFATRSPAAWSASSAASRRGARMVAAAGRHSAGRARRATPGATVARRASAPARRLALDRSIGLLSARAPAQPASRLPPRADAAGAPELVPRPSRTATAAALGDARASDVPLALTGRRATCRGAPRPDARRVRGLVVREPADPLGGALPQRGPPPRRADGGLRRELGPHRSARA